VRSFVIPSCAGAFASLHEREQQAEQHLEDCSDHRKRCDGTPNNNGGGLTRADACDEAFAALRARLLLEYDETVRSELIAALERSGA